MDAEACYRALVARDPRFDGVFFVGVRTTGIYCRPVCPARTPGPTRCEFFRRGAEAERAGYRACFRCRPEIAPGSAAVDAVSALAKRALTRIEEGALNQASLEDLAAELGTSARHLRRALEAEIGVSPVELAQSRRLAIAKALLVDSGSSMTEIAFASGFGSLRRFNSAFRARYARTPSSIRRQGAAHSSGGLALMLSYRPPFAWEALLGFLRGRATAGVEVVSATSYARSAALGAHRGYLEVMNAPEASALRVRVSDGLAGALIPLVTRLRRQFDLDAEPQTIDAHLWRDPALRARVRRTPGLRLPGAIEPFELAVRAVLGQQVSVAAATTIAGRLAGRFGEPLATPIAGLDRLFPAPARIAQASVDELAALGLPGARARTVWELASRVAEGRLQLTRDQDPAELIRELDAVPGIGPWTASYVAMRALSAPDAFPEKDLGLMRALNVDGKTLLRRAERWRPWRAYAALHLWLGGSGG